MVSFCSPAGEGIVVGSWKVVKGAEIITILPLENAGRKRDSSHNRPNAPFDYERNPLCD